DIGASGRVRSEGGQERERLGSERVSPTSLPDRDQGDGVLGKRGPPRHRCRQYRLRQRGVPPVPLRGASGARFKWQRLGIDPEGGRCRKNPAAGQSIPCLRHSSRNQIEKDRTQGVSFFFSDGRAAGREILNL